MKFATIIREAGISIKQFPNLGEIQIFLYDDEDCMVEKEDATFIKPLFEDNPDSFNKFILFIEELNSYDPFNVQITENYVIVFYKTPNAKIFPRKKPSDVHFN